MLTTLLYVVQFSLGAVFAISALGKARNLHTLRRQIIDYQVLPAPLAVAFGVMLVPTEVFLAVSHLTGYLLRVASPSGVLLLIGFGVAVGINLVRGREMACGCFGAEDAELISTLSIVRIVVLALLELALSLWLYHTRGPLNTPMPRGAVDDLPTFWLPSIAFTLLAGMWVFTLPEIINLFAGRHVDSESKVSVSEGVL